MRQLWRSENKVFGANIKGLHQFQGTNFALSSEWAVPISYVIELASWKENKCILSLTHCESKEIKNTNGIQSVNPKIGSKQNKNLIELDWIISAFKKTETDRTNDIIAIFYVYSFSFVSAIYEISLGFYIFIHEDEDSIFF